MLSVNIDMSAMPPLPSSLTPAQRAAVLRSGGNRVQAAIQKNFTGLAAKSNSRRYWKDARNSTKVEMRGDSCAVSVNHKGVRLHWQGGEVRPTGRPSEATGRPTRRLLIPFAESPLRKRRETLAETMSRGAMADYRVVVIGGKNGSALLAAVRQRKKKTDIVWLGRLVHRARFHPRPEVIPPGETLRREAMQGMVQHMKHLLNQKRPKK